ncbi:MAG TPA: hypothetical protein EYP91_17560 [Gammaproteobacteria bacterium]|nr:hypothetical protein [Gammaproteobacteria bacterium]
MARIRVPRHFFAGFENEPADQEIVALRDQLHLHLEPRIIPPGGSAFGSGGGFLPGPKRVLLFAVYYLFFSRDWSPLQARPLA